MTVPLYIRGNNQDLYANALASVYLEGQRLYDPDFALLSDADIYSKVHRDANIKHAMALRKHLVATKEWTVQAAGDGKTDKLAAQIVEDMIKKIRRFGDSMFKLAESIFRGSAWLEIESERAEHGISFGNIGPRKWKYPFYLKDVDRRRMRYVVNEEADEEGVLSVRLEKSDLKFNWNAVEDQSIYLKHVYDDTEERLGYGRGLLEAIYFLQYAKMILLNEGLAAAERWGQGMLKVAISGMRQANKAKPTSAVISQYLSMIKKTKARHFLAHDKDDEMEMVQGPGEGWQIILNMLEYCDKSITTLVLGGTMPTSGGEKGGSYALATTQEDTRDAIIAFDRQSLAESITTDLIHNFIWNHNRAIFLFLGIQRENMPSFKISPKSKTEPDKAAQYITAILGAGIELKADEVYERLGFTQPKSGDAIVTPAQPQQPPMPGGLGGLFQNRIGVNYAQGYKCGERACLKGEDGKYSCDAGDVRLQFCGENECGKCQVSYAQGEPCNQGETAARSKCTPTEEEVNDDSDIPTVAKGGVERPGELLPPRPAQQAPATAPGSVQIKKEKKEQKAPAVKSVPVPAKQAQPQPAPKEAPAEKALPKKAEKPASPEAKPVAKAQKPEQGKAHREATKKGVEQELENMGHKGKVKPNAIDQAIDRFVQSMIAKNIPIPAEMAAKAVAAMLLLDLGKDNA